jgi:hypothetical protein
MQFTNSANAMRQVRLSAHFVAANIAGCETLVEANSLVWEQVWVDGVTASAYGWNTGKFNIYLRS